MNKVFSIFLILMLGITLSACGADEKSADVKKQEEQEVFTTNDLEKVDEMIKFLNERMQEFEAKANQSIKSGAIEIGDNDKFSEGVKKLSQELVIAPVLEKYPNSLISKNSKSIPVTFESSSSESCEFGNCTYDKVKVLGIKYNPDNKKVYKSQELRISQLIFDEVQIFYGEDSSEEEDTASMSFVKTKEGDLIFSENPVLHIETMNLQHYDEELNAIKTNVPESEVEAEQAEYKEEVHETLEKFPELQ